MTARKLDRVIVTQPALRVYREPLFRRVRELQQSESHRDLLVVHGPADAGRAARRDVVKRPWSIEVPERGFRVGRWRLRFRRIPSAVARDALVVTELAAANLNALWLALRRRPFMLWGHGKNYSEDAHPVAARLERFVARRALGILTYMPSGAEFVTMRYRLDPSRVSAFMNTIDTTELDIAMREVSEVSIRAFADRLGISPDRPTLMFVGGLDADKDVPFLAASIRTIASHSDVQVLVAGRGTDEGLVDKVAQEVEGVVRLGYADARSKAHMAAIATAFLCPGKIGLLAVDALVLGRPILSVRGRRHAPEAEYLTAESLRESEPSVEAFAELALAHAVNRDDRKQVPWPHPDIEYSARRVSAAIDAASRLWLGAE